MKKIAASVMLLLAITACNSRYEQENDDKGNIVRRTSERSPFSEYDLEMKGTFTFDEDGTAITGIPAQGYAEYKYNNITINARPAKDGTPIVTIFEKGEKVEAGSDKGKEYLEDAIGRMQKLQAKFK